MTLWLRWGKPAELVFTLDPEDVQDDQDIVGNTGDNYFRVDI